MYLLFALAVSLSAHADDCLNRDQLSSYRDLIHRAAVVDEDGRRTEEQYASQNGLPIQSVQNRFAATGVITCGGVPATAQLTGANNIITTAAHIFYSNRNCAQKRTPEACSFTVKIGGREQTYKVKSALAVGFKCPQEANPLDDWAVVKLETEVRGVTPYDIPTVKEEVRQNDQILSISAGATDYSIVDRASGRRNYPKTIEDCVVKRAVVYDIMARYESNCDSGGGSSGGANLKRIGSRDVLVGITVANNETIAQERAAVRAGKPNAKAYKPGEWATYSLPVNGEFLKALESAVGDRSI